MYAAVALTAFASATLGLLISACVSTTEQVMPLLVVAIMAQLVLCGGLVPVVGRAVLEQLAWIAPSRWGYAVGAASVDLNPRTVLTDDSLWNHDAQTWAINVGVLVVIAPIGAALTGWRLSRVGTR